MSYCLILSKAHYALLINSLHCGCGLVISEEILDQLLAGLPMSVCSLTSDEC